jgi:hypothetical protein
MAHWGRDVWFFGLCFGGDRASAEGAAWPLSCVDASALIRCIGLSFVSADMMITLLGCIEVYKMLLESSIGFCATYPCLTLKLHNCKIWTIIFKKKKLDYQ